MKEKDAAINVFDMAGFSGPVTAEIEILQSEFKNKIQQTKMRQSTDSRNHKFGTEIIKMSARYRQLFDQNIEQNKDHWHHKKGVHFDK